MNQYTYEAAHTNFADGAKNFQYEKCDQER